MLIAKVIGTTSINYQGTYPGRPEIVDPASDRCGRCSGWQTICGRGYIGCRDW